MRARASLGAALLGAALIASGCAPAGGPGGARTASRVRAQQTFTPATPRVSFPGCGPFPRRRAWAVGVSATGRIAWLTPLPTSGMLSSGTAPPLLAAGVAVFAQDGMVHGLNAADGHLLWAWR